MARKKTHDETIFVQIASYRDPELRPTIKDMLDNAKWPENLRICIAWQHAKEDEWDHLTEYLDDPRFKIIDIHYKDAKGVCWARNRLQRYYNGETYTLQLDSHHRFTKNWDETLIDMLKGLQKKGHKKPLLTAYLPGYFPNNDPDGRNIEVWHTNYDRFMPEGPIFIVPCHVDNWQKLTKPIPARFYSGHFGFTLGSFVHDVPHDPDFYFHGEETSISARAFTHGYDLFHPHMPVIWHEYTRQGKQRHWDDHQFSPLDKFSFRKYRALFGIDDESREGLDFVGFDLGKERPLSEFERHVGVDFKGKRVQKHTAEQKMLPIPFKNEKEWEDNYVKRFKYCIDVYKGSLPENDYDCWVIAFKDKNGNEINRMDASESEVKDIIASSPKDDHFYHIWRTFECDEMPHSWKLWPHSVSKDWNTEIIEQEIPR
jgi:glycosyltransferase involved in cell wall biosynthesis